VIITWRSDLKKNRPNSPLVEKLDFTELPRKDKRGADKQLKTTTVATFPFHGTTTHALKSAN
jgi:hypothetical protein